MKDFLSLLFRYPQAHNICTANCCLYNSFQNIRLRFNVTSGISRDHNTNVWPTLSNSKDLKRFSFSVNRCRILVPNDASIAVMQGAVMFGQKPNIVDSRIMSTTYGFGTNHHFDSNIHPIEKRCVIEGVTWCKDCFVVLVKENDIIRVGEKKSFPNYRPLKGSQTTVKFNFYNSTNPEAKYTTDAAVGSSIGKVVVESPDVSKGTDRKIDVCVAFGSKSPRSIEPAGTLRRHI